MGPIIENRAKIVTPRMQHMFGAEKGRIKKPRFLLHENKPFPEASAASPAQEAFPNLLPKLPNLHQKTMLTFFCFWRIICNELV